MWSLAADVFVSASLSVHVLWHAVYLAMVSHHVVHVVSAAAMLTMPKL